MASQDEQELRYSYRFTLPAGRTGSSATEEPQKAEIQAYINEVLGVSKRKDSER